MPNRNGLHIFGAVAGVLLIVVLLVSYRARTFHYCAGLGGRPPTRVVEGSESCGPGEEPLDWLALGWPAKLKLAVQTTATALGAN